MRREGFADKLRGYWDGILSRTQCVEPDQEAGFVRAKVLQELYFSLASPRLPIRTDLFCLHVSGYPEKGAYKRDLAGYKALVEVPSIFCGRA